MMGFGLSMSSKIIFEGKSASLRLYNMAAKAGVGFLYDQLIMTLVLILFAYSDPGFSVLIPLNIDKNGNYSMHFQVNL